MRKNFYEANETIKNILQKGDPASVIRLDNTVGYVLDSISRGEPIVAEFLNPEEMCTAGIYPETYDYYFNKILPKVFESMLNSDLLGFVDISEKVSESPLLQHFGDKDMFFRDAFLVMDPGALLGYAQKAHNIYLGDPKDMTGFIPWTASLKNKKVLMVSTHVDSIKSQWQKMDIVWGDKKDLIVPFELVDVIRAPYHPNTDNRQYADCNEWLDMVEKMKQDIDTRDYDVVICGATSLSPMIVDHAKRTGKIGIQTGGVLQLFFGIKGARWVYEPHYKLWNDMFNENWIYPLDSDKPQNMQLMNTKETGFAYWGR